MDLFPEPIARRLCEPVTRRQLLRAAGYGAGGLALVGTGGGLLGRALASSGARHPGVPHWRSRPDLRIPALGVLSLEDAASRDPVFIAPYNAPNGAQAGAVIVSAEGEPLWENPIANRVTTDFRVQSYRASPVLTWWEGIIELGHGVGEYVIADTAYRTVRRVQAGRGLKGDLHEFVITPRDTALLTSYEVVKADLSSVGGPRHGTVQDAIFQELDLATGRVLMEWRSLDHVPIEDSAWPVSADWDYFHINSVDMDADGTLLISARNTHTVYRLARDGSIIWRLGGSRSDFALGPGASFHWQHDVRRQPGGTITVFDNGASPAVEKRSRALILALDETAMTATLLSQYSHRGVLAQSQGNVQLLDNGNVFVGWGEIPRVSEFERSGRLVFDALLGKDYECYRAFRMPWSATPAQAPAIALARHRAGLTAYASWNGATTVAAWRLLAGPTPKSLAPVASVRAQGFETAIPCPAAAIPSAAGAFASVEALDSSGNALGRSAIVRA